jgi:hypothetical protein
MAAQAKMDKIYYKEDVFVKITVHQTPNIFAEINSQRLDLIEKHTKSILKN